jgi:hypothetical protein
LNVGDKARLYQLEAWIDGYLSGVNTGGGFVADILASRPGDAALYAYVDNYCRPNPLDSIGEAAVALAKDLLARAQRR